MKTAIVLIALGRVAAANDEVTVQYNATALLLTAAATGPSLGYEHRLDRANGMTAHLRVERGSLAEDPVELTMFTALAGYRITTADADEVSKAFAAIELGWQGVRFDRAMGDFGAIYPVSWENRFDLELSGGFRVMKYVTLELRVQLPTWGVGLAAGVTL